MDDRDARELRPKGFAGRSEQATAWQACSLSKVRSNWLYLQNLLVTEIACLTLSSKEPATVDKSWFDAPEERDRAKRAKLDLYVLVQGGIAVMFSDCCTVQ